MLLCAAARTPVKESASRSQILLSSGRPLGWKCLLTWNQPLLSAAPHSQVKISQHGQEKPCLDHPPPMVTVSQWLPTEIFTGSTLLLETLAQDRVLVSFLAQVYKWKQELLGVFANSIFRKCSGKDLEYLKCVALRFLLPQPQIYVVTHHS